MRLVFFYAAIIPLIGDSVKSELLRRNVAAQIPDDMFQHWIPDIQNYFNFILTSSPCIVSGERREDDVFQALRKLRDQGRSFDFIILDPPKFAPTAAFAEKAARGYKDINLLGFKLLRPGGLLATYSCSGGISADLFQKIIAGAALDAGVDAQIIHHLHASADHPVLLSFPEGAYLKGLVLRVGL